MIKALGDDLGFGCSLAGEGEGKKGAVAREARNPLRCQC